MVKMGFSGYLRKVIKGLAARAKVETYERMSTFAILREDMSRLLSATNFETRELLWDHVIQQKVGSDEKIVYIEFGVHQGYSIRHFLKSNANPKSIFIGLDSFEGLPEDWGTMPKGTFDTQGNMPKIDDPRVTFFKGWFQDTAPDLLELLAKTDGKLIVNFDADLYSSTLFALTQIDTLKKKYVAIFDEFTGHETRALYNYTQAFSAEVTFEGKTEFPDGYPFQVAAVIEPHMISTRKK
jgi:Macrocin-O-methyltransferase (TylF)